MNWYAVAILVGGFASAAVALIIAVLVTVALDLLDRRVESDQ